MSNWPYISYADIVCGFIIPFWTIKGMVNIKNRGWNLMGIAHYAIRLVNICKNFPQNKYAGEGLFVSSIKIAFAHF